MKHSIIFFLFWKSQTRDLLRIKVNERISTSESRIQSKLFKTIVREIEVIPT